MVSNRYDTEADIIRKSLKMLNRHYGLFWKVHTTGIPDPRLPGRYRKNPNAGQLDVTGIVPVQLEVSSVLCERLGLRVDIEFKRPGNRLTEKQKEVMEALKRECSIAFMATSVNECEERLKQEFLRVGIELCRKSVSIEQAHTVKAAR